MMKTLRSALLALGLLAWSQAATAQIIIGGGGGGGGSPPGGSSGQTQYNNAGAFGGFTPSGDLSVVPSTGVYTVTKTNGVSFATSATTDTTNAANITSGILAGARLPNPSASVLGGIESLAAVSHNFINAISTSGVPSAVQPVCADLSDAAASCATNALNASNISSGTLAAARGGAGTITGALKGNGAGLVTQAACADLSNASASCSTDATNASNISAGTLAAARGGAGAVNGLLKANGSGVVSLAVSGTDYAPGSVVGTVTSVTSGLGLASTAGTCASGAITGSGTLSVCNSVATKTTNYTLVNGDGGSTINVNAAGTVTITVPAATSSGNFANGWGTCLVSQQGLVTVTAASGTPFYGSVGTSLSTFNFNAGLTVCLQSDGTNWLITGANSFQSTVTGIFTMQSGEIGATRVVTGAGAVTATTADRYICIAKGTPAATTVNLFSSPITGTLLTVMDCGGNGVANNYTITPAAGNIDGSATFVINTAYGAWTGVYANSGWHTVASR